MIGDDGGKQWHMKYCINCISWSNWSCIFDIMWFYDLRVHVTIVFFCKSVWKTTKLWIWRDVNSVPFLCEDTNPRNWFFSSFESSSNNLLDKFQLGDSWIAFLIASLRIDEWWMSSQNHTVRLTSIHYRVFGNQNFCFAPTETINGRVKK